MAQNIYDTEEFFAGYSGLPRSVRGLDGAPEWASLRAMLPDLRGSRVLDLGCGFGWFCRAAREAGAAHVTGIDISEKMLARAAEMTHDDAITYRRANLEELTLEQSSFDLVYSSLAFHYVDQLPRLIAEVHKALVPGGQLVFSAEHPIYTAPSHPGWFTAEDGHRTWPLDSYLKEGPRSTDWLATGVIKQHRTLGTYLNMLVASGFSIDHVEEWSPTDEQIAGWPELAAERDRPMLVLMSARR